MGKAQTMLFFSEEFFFSPFFNHVVSLSIEHEDPIWYFTFKSIGGSKHAAKDHKPMRRAGNPEEERK